MHTNRLYILIGLVTLVACSTRQQNRHLLTQTQQNMQKLEREHNSSGPSTSHYTDKNGSVSEKQRVAVLDLQNRARLDQESVSYLSNLVRQAASRLPSQEYSVMTKDNIQVMLPPDVQIEDCQGSCAVDTGRRIGVHWILIGEVIKFGKELRITLNLHHSASGELRGSEMVRGSNLESLEGPLQGTAVGLFSELDPDLKATAERLKRGFVFKKFNYNRIPDISEQIRRLSEEDIEAVQIPKPQTKIAITGVDFGEVDVENLEIYDSAVQIDKSEEFTPEEKIEQWEVVKTKVPSFREEAQYRIDQWLHYLKQVLEYEREKRLQAEMKESRRQEASKKLSELLIELVETEQKRKVQMSKDFDKLKRLLNLSVVSQADKIKWVEAFIESYGAIVKLNQYLPQLLRWTKRIRGGFEDLQRESRREYRRKQNYETNLRYEILSLNPESQSETVGFREAKNILSYTTKPIDIPILKVECPSLYGGIYVNGIFRGRQKVYSFARLGENVTTCIEGTVSVEKKRVFSHQSHRSVILDINYKKNLMQKSEERSKVLKKNILSTNRITRTASLYVALISLGVSAFIYWGMRQAVINEGHDLHNELLTAEDNYMSIETELVQTQDRIKKFESMSSTFFNLGLTSAVIYSLTYALPPLLIRYEF
jgi:hypothetical protein